MRTQDGKAFENVEWRAFNDQNKTNKMNETVKNAASRTELKERIIETAMRLFTDNGIRSITMDEIAASLGISKRTLYEIFVDKEALLRQLKLEGEEKRLELYFHKRLMDDTLPLSIGGGIGQSRLCMYYLRKAHIGEIQASIWPESMREECLKHNIHLI